MENEEWSLLFETKEAAIEGLVELQHRRPGNLSSEEYQALIQAVESLDLTRPPHDGEAIFDGWRWVIRIKFTHQDISFYVDLANSAKPGPSRRLIHEISFSKEPLIYGLSRRD